MTRPLDDTHDPALESWLDSANDPACDFPIQNLPFGRFRRAGSIEPLRIGVAIGDQVLDLREAGQPAVIDALRLTLPASTRNYTARVVSVQQKRAKQVLLTIKQLLQSPSLLLV